MELRPLLFVLLSLGLVWSKSSYGKFRSGTFVSSLSPILSKFSPDNPYPWFKRFLTSVVAPNARFFGLLILWGELLAAISITVGALLLLLNPDASSLVYLMTAAGLAGGLLLNVVFWFGFGWTHPSTDSVNLLMAAVEIIGIFFLLKGFLV